jgi:diguanylate cyclase (GGDEF)-like protein
MRHFLKETSQFFNRIYKKLAASNNMEEVKFYELLLLNKLLIMVYVFSSVAGIFLGIAWNMSAYHIAIFSIGMLFLAAVLVFMSRKDISYKVNSHLTGIILLLSLFLVFHVYYRQLNVLNWFILVICVMMVSTVSSKIIGAYIAGFSLLSFILASTIFYKPSFTVDVAFEVTIFMMMIVVFALYFLINNYVHNILGGKMKRYNELERKNKEIMALYDDLDEKETNIFMQNQKIKETEVLVDYLSNKDTLTGLINRRTIQNTVREMIDSGEVSNFAVIFIDLDNFKRINDTMGHSTGDYLLNKVTDRLKKVMYKQDILGRAGGDEFVILVKQDLTTKKLRIYTGELLNSFIEPFKIKQIMTKLTGSFGVACWPQDGVSGDDILKKAETAMYSAKKSGGSKVVYYETSMEEEMVKNIQLENMLLHSLKHNEMYLEYQPLINISTDEVASFEALLRWECPGHGKISPGKFIPLAEENCYIIELGQWVIMKACERIKYIEETYGMDVNIAVNISPVQFHDKEFVDKVKNSVELSEIKPEQLILEITESVLIYDLEKVFEILDELKDYGFRIAIDDFGTGFSSMEYLMVLPVDIMKIDKTFSDKINEENEKKVLSQE